MSTSEGPEASRSPGGTRSDLSGSAGDVVQARDIAGGIHFHSPGGDRISGESVPAQLPADVRGFVNRVTDLKRMDDVLADTGNHPRTPRVCVLTGTAGVGKTSLAVHWGHRARDRFPDGQLYVNLRGYDPGQPITAGQALERFLTALGIASTALPIDLETRSALFRTVLAHRRVLVVLDNAATVKQVRPLLPGAGGSLVIVTSRSRLSGLVARDGAHRLDVDLFDESAAVELVHGTVAGYRYGDSEHDIAELARLCARLPLALRIAAERAAVRPHMPMSELIENLRDESHVWSALSVEDDDEADAVRTVFAWSYRALPPEVARMFRLLGLHPSAEFSSHAAAAVAAVPPWDARQLLDALVGAHLLDQIGHDRYQFHDLLRAYAIDQVRHKDTVDDRDAATCRILAWYLHTTGRCLPELPIPILEPIQDIELDDPPTGIEPLTFTEPETALSWFDTERANLVACVQLAAKTGNDQMAWQMPALLRRPYAWSNSVDDWFLTTELGIDAARRLKDTAAEALLLESLTMAYRQTHRLERAEEIAQKALGIFRRSGHHRGVTLTLNMLALINGSARRFNNAHEYFSEARVLAERHDYRELLALITTNHAWIYVESGQYQEAYDRARSSLGPARLADNPAYEIDALTSLMRASHGLGNYAEAVIWGDLVLSMSLAKMTEGAVLIYYGDAQRDRGHPEIALTSYQRAVIIHRQLGNRGKEADSFDSTGTAHRILNRLDDAASFHLQALALYREIGSGWGIATALDHLALVSVDSGQPDDAVHYWTEALSILDDFDDPATSRLRDSVNISLEQFSP
ncbi:ATP-binding protein [Nocardia suismassiliense]|uniref:ATP-binding protein n=1 Tax=Nocardia suismassiliense TaxID=2077092 RepID=A0ABW6QZZ1_9NOCA